MLSHCSSPARDGSAVPAASGAPAAPSGGAGRGSPGCNLVFPPVNWVDHSKTLREQGVDETELLLLRRKYFYSDANVDAR